MLQRIQSIWLLLAAVTLILMLVLPIATKEIKGAESEIYTNGLHQKFEDNNGSSLGIEPFFPLLITNIAVAALAFINIFNFKRRSLQKRIIIFTIVAIGGFAFWCSVYAKKIPGGLDGASFGVGAYLPALAILFCVLAIFGINKDERLIRSAERLR
jgi:ABC-type multidrug transport system permease subunit